jgi:hypothetical protein
LKQSDAALAFFTTRAFFKTSFAGSQEATGLLQRFVSTTVILVEIKKYALAI